VAALLETAGNFFRMVCIMMVTAFLTHVFGWGRANCKHADSADGMFCTVKGVSSGPIVLVGVSQAQDSCA
jgi:hypothetical protein